jgi:uncharacterized protein (DUF433 family)
MGKLDFDVLRRMPAYPFVEAAHYLDLPTSTLRAWCVGQDHPGKGHPRKFVPVIRLDGRPGEGLSFLNLIEAHVLAAIRRMHGIPLPKVRRALAFVGKQLGIDRPLARAEFQTDGVDLFVEELGRLVNASRDGQFEIASMLRTHLRRIERDRAGLPIKLYPFSGRQGKGEAPAPIEIDPRVAFGRPVLTGRGVPTAVLADRFKAGDTLQEIASDYGTSTQDIEEAIRCELDRRAAA